MPRRTVSYGEEVLSRIEITPDGCWRWTGYTLPNRGWGQVGRNLLTHRVVWEHLRGPIPDGMTLDHECHNRDTTCPGGNTCLHRRCVNPDHLALATRGENALSSPTSVAATNRAKKRCKRGHPFSPENTYYRPDRYGRICITCRDAALERLRPAYAAKRAARRVQRSAA